MMLAIEVLLVKQEPHKISKFKIQGCSLLVMPLFGVILGCLQRKNYLILALRNGVYKMMISFLSRCLYVDPEGVIDNGISEGALG